MTGIEFREWLRANEERIAEAREVADALDLMVSARDTLHTPKEELYALIQVRDAATLDDAATARISDRIEDLALLVHPDLDL